MFFRTKILFRPTENSNILTTVILSDLKNGYDAWAPDNNKTYVTYSDRVGKDSQNTKAGSIKWDYHFLNNFNLKAISSYSTTQQVHAYDGDWANDEYWLIEHGFDPDIEGWNYSFYDSNYRIRNNFSQEFRLSNGKIYFRVFLQQIKGNR